MESAQEKEQALKKKHTRWAVSEIHLESELSMINCLENAISLPAILSMKYLVVVVEDLLRRTA
jgi:hypothetical protein